MTASYYRGASGIMVVYDITDPESFNNINSWLIEIEKYFIIIKLTIKMIIIISFICSIILYL